MASNASSSSISSTSLTEETQLNKTKDDLKLEKKRITLMPQKKFYRSRAHCNPLSHNDGFEYPTNPDFMDWSSFYPNLQNPKVEFLDVGCGFGGLTVTLAKLFPEKVVLGMEIRPKVCEYVRLRIQALRDEFSDQYQNASVLRTNAMRYLPNFFFKGQLEKLFFCFPDPQFKTKNHRRRIVNTHLLTEYAYLLKEHALLYTITDVEELHEWHVEKCQQHPCFEALTMEEMEKDPCVQAMKEETEEGKKVARANGKKYFAVFRRIRDQDVPIPQWFTDLPQKQLNKE